ncbi:MAG: DM13 domain-containing protein [Pseudomonadota bacterium]
MNKSPLFAPGAIAVALVVALFSATLAIADSVVHKSSFEGRSNHVVKGNVAVVQLANGTYRVDLGEDFFLDGAPDPKVAFGDNDKADTATLMPLLKSNRGAQSYAVPPSVNPGKYSQVFIWCEKFAVPLGAASLK